MAHHRRAPDSSRSDEKASPEFTLHSTEVSILPEKNTSGEIEKGTQEIRPAEKRRGIFDQKIAGFPWPFFVEMVIIAIGLLGLLLKVFGLF